MSTFFTGWFRRAAAIARVLAANSPALPRSKDGNTGLHVEQLEPRNQCAVDVMQDGNYIIIDGLADPNSLQVQHQPGDAFHPYYDKILVRWQSNGVAHSKAFDLYKYVNQGAQRRPVKNVEYLEVSGGSGRNRFWTQARLSSYLPAEADLQRAREEIFGDENGSLWKRIGAVLQTKAG